MKSLARAIGFVILPLTPWLLMPRASWAQQSSGMISGVVQDAQGAVVPGATVTLINQAQGAVFYRTETSPEGTFVFTPVPPGVYTVTVERAGFKKFTKTDIQVFAQDRVGLPPIVLEVGAVTESVTVAASAVALQTVSAERSGVITSNQITELASYNRIWSDLLKTITGFNPDTSNVNGLRADQNAVMVDGVSTMDTGNNSSGVMMMRLNTDLIGEFKVVTNAQQAEFGRAAGANITIVTRSGTREFHGTAYAFFQNEWMNANSWINNYNGRPRARNRLRQQGFTLGGPIFIPGRFNADREKLFFFTNYEGLRPRAFDTLRSLTVPTEAERQGDFSLTQENNKPVPIKDPTTGQAFPGNLIPKDRINKYGSELLNFFPKPNRSGDPAYNYQYEFAGTDSRDDFLIRADWNISTNWKFFARFSKQRRVRYQHAGLNVNNVIGISGFHADNGNISGAGNLTVVITPTLTNELNFGHVRNWLPNEIGPDSKYLRKNSGITLPLLFPKADPLGVIPNMTFDVPNPPNIFIAGMQYDNENPTTNITDNVAKVTARHTMKFGIFIETSFKRQTATMVNNGRIDFSRDSSNPGDTGWAFANALLGNFRTFDQSSTYRKGYYRYHTYEWYAQDNWRARPNLTLDYGVRFSVLQPWFDEKDQVSGFRADRYRTDRRVLLYRPALVAGKRVAVNPLTAEVLPAALIGAIVPNSGDLFNGMVEAGKGGVERGLIKRSGLLIGPRFGLAWVPGGPQGKTVVRAGGGVFYERIQGNVIFNQISYPPGLLTPLMYYGNLNNIATSSGTFFPLTVAGMSPEGKVPTVYNYNLSVQRELPWQVLLDIGYVGTLGRHLVARMPFNEAPFGSAWLAENQDPTKGTALTGDNALPVDFLRPYTGYAGLAAAVAQSGLGGGGFITTFGSSTNYNGLQLSANRRVAKDLTLGIKYTWSKVLGTDTDYQFVGHPVDHRKANYGLLHYDRSQVLVINYIYNLPEPARQGSALGHPVFRVLLNGWQVSGVTTFSTGAPMVVGGGTSVSATGRYSVQGVGAATLNRRITGSEGWSPRPRITCNPNLPRSKRTLGAYIDTSCFLPAEKGSMGMDSAIRPFRGPGINNWDISVYKRIGLHRNEQRYLQLRLEMYNAFNHTQWSNFNFTPTFDPNTGKITNLSSLVGGGGGRFGFGALNEVRSPRTIQMAAKIYF